MSCQLRLRVKGTRIQGADSAYFLPAPHGFKQDLGEMSSAKTHLLGPLIQLCNFCVDF